MAWPKGVPRPKKVATPSPDTQAETEDAPLEDIQPLPFRKLWELRRKYGAVVVNDFDRLELESALAAVGFEQEPPVPENIEDYWSFASRFVGKGPITALDKAGDFSATVYPDGRCDLVKHTLPNRLSRHPGVAYADEIIKIQNLEAFTMHLFMLLNECDVIFDETVEKHNANEQEFQEQAVYAEGVKDGTIHGADPRIEQMWIIADELALTGPHRPHLNQLPFKLAVALGLKLKTEEGIEKDWQALATEVVEHANLDDTPAGGVYQRNPQEPKV
jgi:hypothetical protein